MTIATSNLDPVTAAEFLSGMRRLAGAVCLVTTVHQRVRYGLTATAVCSLAIDPPSLLVCVNKSASPHDPIGRAGIFAVNVLSRDQAELAKLFSSTAHIERRFAGEVWSSGVTGAPLLEGAFASFECLVDQEIQKTTHTIFIGNVKRVRLGSADQPLVYLDGAFGTFLPFPGT